MEIVGFGLAGRADGQELVQILGNSRRHKNLLIERGLARRLFDRLQLWVVKPATVEINQSLTSSAPALRSRGFFYCLYFQLILFWLSSLLSPDKIRYSDYTRIALITPRKTDPT